eukprot:8065583-Lingulodinium_polyedra.AAC.1
MDYLRPALGCPPDADVFRFVESAGAYDCALLDHQHRRGSPFAPVCDRSTGTSRRPAARGPTVAELAPLP